MKTIKNQGITLIELIIVISIIGILAVALGFEFTGWMGGYRAESQTKEMYVDLMNARARAMQRNRAHFVRLNNATSYSIYEDDSDGSNKVPDGDGTLQTGTGNGADTQLPTFPKTVQYTLNSNGAGIPVTFTFDSRGLISPLRTVWVTSTSGPDYDCIVLSVTRINMGRRNGASCDAK